jgi:hypothetical protein
MLLLYVIKEIQDIIFLKESIFLDKVRIYTFGKHYAILSHELRWIVVLVVAVVVYLCLNRQFNDTLLAIQSFKEKGQL